MQEGWGRGTWGLGAWGTPLYVNVPVTGQQTTSSLGSMSVVAGAVIQLTGFRLLLPLARRQLMQRQT